MTVDDLIEMFGLEWGDYVEYLEEIEKMKWSDYVKGIEGAKINR